MSKKSSVGIIMGSSSDSRIMHSAAEIFDQFNVSHEDQIISAHRTPTRLDTYAKHAEDSGFKNARAASSNISLDPLPKIIFLLESFSC